MRAPTFRHFAVAALAAAFTVLLTSCGTTGTKVSSRQLPAYEPPMARSDFQNVRTTAYTHSEADHLQYGAKNAIGGRLYAASRPFQSAAYSARALPVSSGASPAYPNRSLESYLTPQKRRVTKWVKGKRGKKKQVTVTEYVRPTIGSAAADWSRWPVGTTFRLLSTGQIYKVDDYGWALAGRNTIDLYMPNRSAMNTWGVRHEPLQILRWGDPATSRQILGARQGYKHCRRMLLALDGQHEAAAAIQ